MEEKKVCAECENREHKLETLTQEEAGKIAGGTPSAFEWDCPQCYTLVSFSNICPKCNYRRTN